MNTPADFAQPSARRRVLAVVSGAVRLGAWIDRGDGTFAAPVPYIDDEAALTGLEVDGAEVDYTLEGETVVLDADPRGSIAVAVLAFRFTNDASEVDGVPYHGRLRGAPKMRLAVPEQFGEVEQKGGGQMTLENGDGLFDRLDRVTWRQVAFYAAVEV